MCYYAYLYVVLGIKPRASRMPGKLSITQATLVLGAERRTHKHALQTDKALSLVSHMHGCLSWLS